MTVTQDTRTIVALIIFFGCYLVAHKVTDIVGGIVKRN